MKMKAHIQKTAAPKILFYPGGGTDQSQAAAAFCQAEQIPFREVFAGLLGNSLGYLAGIPGFSPAESSWDQPLPQRDAMIFCGMEEKQVRQLLEKMNRSGLQVELKAVMTPHNRSWPFGALLAELEKEHLALHRQKAAPGEKKQIP